MLWIAVFMAPVAFFLHLQVNYALVPWACSTGNTFPIHIATFVAMALAGAGCFTTWRSWRHAGTIWPDDARGSLTRTRFMAALGFLMGILFLLVILAQAVPTFIFEPCL
jgi:hypothetical protein